MRSWNKLLAPTTLMPQRDELHQSLQAAQEKLHEALKLRREQEAELMDLRAAHVCVRRKDARRSLRISQGEEQLQEHMRGALAEPRQWVATTATLPVPAPAAARAMDTDLDDARRPTLQIRVRV